MTKTVYAIVEAGKHAISTGNFWGVADTLEQAERALQAYYEKVTFIRNTDKAGEQVGGKLYECKTVFGSIRILVFPTEVLGND